MAVQMRRQLRYTIELGVFRVFNSPSMVLKVVPRLNVPCSQLTTLHPTLRLHTPYVYHVNVSRPFDRPPGEAGRAVGRG